MSTVSRGTTKLPNGIQERGVLTVMWPTFKFFCLYRIFKTDEAIRIPNFGIQIDRGEH